MVGGNGTMGADTRRIVPSGHKLPSSRTSNAIALESPKMVEFSQAPVEFQSQQLQCQILYLAEEVQFEV